MRVETSPSGKHIVIIDDHGSAVLSRAEAMELSSALLRLVISCEVIEAIRDSTAPKERTGAKRP